MAAISAMRPPTWTGMIARVRVVTLLRRIAADRGTAYRDRCRQTPEWHRAYMTALAVATNVYGGTITSSPGTTPTARSAHFDGRGAVGAADGVRGPLKRREFLFETAHALAVPPFAERSTSSSADFFRLRHGSARRATRNHTPACRPVWRDARKCDCVGMACSSTWAVLNHRIMRMRAALV